MRYGTEPSNWQDRRIQRKKLKRMWKTLQETHYDYDVATEKAMMIVVLMFGIIMWAFGYIATH